MLSAARELKGVLCTRVTRNGKLSALHHAQQQERGRSQSEQSIYYLKALRARQYNIDVNENLLADLLGSSTLSFNADTTIALIASSRCVSGTRREGMVRLEVL